MRVAPEFQTSRYGGWRFIAQPDRWSAILRARVLALVEQQPAARHPQTIEFREPAADPGRLYLKVFHARPGIFALKDLFRASKAARALRMSRALAASGFGAPPIFAAGELRVHGVLRRAFVISRAIDGAPAPVFLREQYYCAARRLAPGEKRRALAQLAELIGRFHRLGFVHGDLVPSNIFVAQTEASALRFYFMDNDRTRRYPRWMPQTLWKRNLIQLNRFPLPGISLEDRLRFFRDYRGRSEAGPADGRLLRWLERKTRARRMECDAADARVGFRSLMRWRDGAAPIPTEARPGAARPCR